MKSTLIYLTWNHSCSSKKGQTRAQDDTKNDSHTIKLVLDIYESLEVGSREHTASVHWCVKVQWSVNLVSKKVRLWKRLNWFQNFKHCTHHQNSKKAKNGCALQPNRHDIRSIGGVPSMKCLKLGCADHFDRSCEGPKWPVTLLTIIFSINVYPLLRVTGWFATWTPLVICSSLSISSTWVQFILISEKSGTLLCYEELLRIGGMYVCCSVDRLLVANVFQWAPLSAWHSFPCPLRKGAGTPESSSISIAAVPLLSWNKDLCSGLQILVPKPWASNPIWGLLRVMVSWLRIWALRIPPPSSTAQVCNRLLSSFFFYWLL